jgi:hypothetical protein
MVGLHFGYQGARVFYGRVYCNFSTRIHCTCNVFSAPLHCCACGTRDAVVSCRKKSSICQLFLYPPRPTLLMFAAMLYHTSNRTRVGHSYLFEFNSLCPSRDNAFQNHVKRTQSHFWTWVEFFGIDAYLFK